MDDERVEISSALGDLGWRGTLEVFLFIFPGLWVLVLEDEVDLDLWVSGLLQNKLNTAYLVRGAALVGAKHDDIRRGIGKFLRV